MTLRQSIPALGNDRRAFVLPFVVLALAAGSLITLAFAGEALQAVRAVRASVRGDDARYQSDAALNEALAMWTRDSLWTQVPGAPIRTTVTLPHGPVIVEWERLHPLAASVRTIAGGPGARAIDATVRDHLRAVWLVPPPVPVAATLTTNAEVTGGEGTLISGSDLVLPGSPCGVDRDTVSVPPVMSLAVRGDPAGSWPGAPLSINPAGALEDSVRAALGVIGGRLSFTSWDSLPRALPASSAWRALRLSGPSVRIAGPTQWRGLLIVHGETILSGAVDVTGILLVDGHLDASAAQLSVQGAVVVADTSARGVMLGARSRLFYDRCAVQMALATVSRPSLAPFSLWQSLPH